MTKYIDDGSAVIYIYIFNIILPLSCTDGKYFYHISSTALSSGTNYG